MKVPAYIKKEMRKVAYYNNLASNHMKKVEEWIESKGINILEEGLRDGSGCGLEELEYGADITEELCERIEAMLEVEE